MGFIGFVIFNVLFCNLVFLALSLFLVYVYTFIYRVSLIIEEINHENFSIASVVLSDERN